MSSTTTRPSSVSAGGSFPRRQERKTHAAARLYLVRAHGLGGEDCGGPAPEPRVFCWSARIGTIIATSPNEEPRKMLFPLWLVLATAAQSSTATPFRTAVSPRIDPVFGDVAACAEPWIAFWLCRPRWTRFATNSPPRFTAP